MQAPEDLILSPTCSINIIEQTISRSGRIIRLTDIQYRILDMLIEYMPFPVAQSDIIKKIWGIAKTGSKENLRVQIRKIRRRIEVEPSRPAHLITVHGHGYLLYAHMD